MRSALILITFAFVATAGDTQAPPLLSVSGDLTPGVPKRHEVVVAGSPGDVIAGTLELRGVSARVRVLDDASEIGSSPRGAGSQPFGFVSRGPGRYVIEISLGADTATAEPGSYRLVLQPGVPVAERMKDSHVHPRIDHRSERMSALLEEAQRDPAGAEARFWSEVSRVGTPLLEGIPNSDTEVFATFVWRATYDTSNVLLQWPAAGRYYMTQIPNTSVWYQTLRIRKASRFPYFLSPNDIPAERGITIQPDPLNPRSVYGGAASLLELEGAPDMGWFDRTPPRTGRLEQKTFASKLLTGEQQVWVYTPAGYKDGSVAHPLLILFNGMSYAQREQPEGVDAITIVENLAAVGRIRAPVMCFVGQPSTNELRSNDVFAEAVATELVPWLRSSYAVSPEAADTVVGGSSAGGVWGAYIGLTFPEVFGKVLSQSGAFRQDLGEGPNTLSAIAIRAAPSAVRSYLDVGLYDQMPGATGPLDALALDESNTTGNRHFRDVLRAKGFEVIYRETGGGHDLIHWRGALPEALVALLPAGTGPGR